MSEIKLTAEQLEILKAEHRQNRIDEKSNLSNLSVEASSNE